MEMTKLENEILNCPEPRDKKVEVGDLSRKRLFFAVRRDRYDTVLSKLVKELGGFRNCC
jgi:hypothetical protein